jgi:hypothetical protein
MAFGGVRPRKVQGVISNLQNASREYIIETIQEDNELAVFEDGYEKYDPEPGEEKMIKGMGGTIIDSRIELTDSVGMNRTIVRRNNA